MWDRLLECHTTDAEQARRGRWLNALLLSFIALTAVITASLVFAPSAAFLASDLTLLALELGLYYANRRGAVTLAAGGLCLMVTGGILLGALVLPTDLPLALLYPTLLSLIVSTAGVFLSWRILPLVIPVLSGLAVWYYVFSPVPVLADYRGHAPDAIVRVAVLAPLLYLVTGVLSWLISRLLQTTLTDLRVRNGELQRAYDTLVTQTEREHQLGADISELAGQLSVVSARQVTGVASQADSINEVVSTVTELHNTADQIAQVAQQVQQVADSALTSVQQAQTLVLDSRAAIARNRVQVEQVITQMTNLDHLTGQITAFVDGIQELADETRLLALNATIEAAGAGPLGRRFGVVANEVQNLAGRSNELGEQIRAVLAALREAGQVTLTTTQGNIAVAHEVESLADQVRATQEQVVGAVQHTAGLVQVISSATTQQTAATAQMRQTMQHIRDVADTTRHDSGALEGVINDLTHAAESLTNAMAWLRPQTHP